MEDHRDLHRILFLLLRLLVRELHSPVHDVRPVQLQERAVEARGRVDPPQTQATVSG